MDSDEPRVDPFGVQLEWPESLRGDPLESSAALAPFVVEPAGTQLQENVGSPIDDSLIQAPSPGSRSSLSNSEEDSSHVLMAKIVARVDALTSATTTFRNLVSERVSEYTERVVEVASVAGTDLEEQRRLIERDLAAMRAEVARATTAVERLESSLDALTTKVESIAAELGDQLARVFDEVQTLRRRTAVRPRATAREEVDSGDPAPPRRPTRRR